MSGSDEPYKHVPEFELAKSAVLQDHFDDFAIRLGKGESNLSWLHLAGDSETKQRTPRSAVSVVRQD